MDQTHVSPPIDADRRVRAMSRLVSAVQDLSLARSIADVVRVVRTTARALTQADGATFILRDREQCYYVDEDAIGPLWKGQRFPLEACVSGWSMMHRKPVVIPDIFDDPRVPVDAYRPTFVKSLVMVPIRTVAPIGAIGTYWARHYRAEPYEVELLQSLANTASVALENASVYQELEQRVRERTAELERTNEALEAFSASVSHDLRNPLTTITGLASLALHDGTQLPSEHREYLQEIGVEARRMTRLIDDLLRLARISRAELELRTVDLSALAGEAIERQRRAAPDRAVETEVEPGLVVRGDPGLLTAVMDNLIGNAWKYTARRTPARISVRREPVDGDEVVIAVRDNGAGFDMSQAAALFAPFKRLHSAKEFPGVGIGLATVRRIIERHGGRIWAEAEPDKGAAFLFTLPQGPARSA